MILIILGLIIFIAAFNLKSMQYPLPNYANAARFIGLGVMVLGFLTACIKQIDAGQIGVKSMFGKVQDEVITSGLSIVNPLVDVNRIDIKTQNYTMSGVHDEGDKSGDDAIRVLTADGLEVIIDLTVLYRVLSTEAPKLVKETGLDYRDKIVRPITRTKIRDNAVYYTAVDLYSNKRDEFQTRIFKPSKIILKSEGWCSSNCWFVTSLYPIA